MEYRLKSWQLSESQKTQLMQLLGITKTPDNLPETNNPCELYMQHNVPLPMKMDYSECLLKWEAGNAVGKCDSRYSTALFTPNSTNSTLPLPGTLASIQFLDTIHKVLILAQSPKSIIITLAAKFQERRQHPRFHNGGIAILKIGGKSIRTAIKNLSANGIGIESTVLVELGTRVDVLLRLEGKKHLPIECSGIIVNERRPRQAVNGHRIIGIQIIESSNEFKNEITKLADFDSQKFD